MDLSAMARELEDQMIAWRRDIYAHPELGFEELRTARLVSDALRDMGLVVETGVGRTGVVGRLGEPPPATGLRADMDALPIRETNEVTYASQVPGVMHACGHDAHVAMLLGAAQLLTRLQDDLPGEVWFLFQPEPRMYDEDFSTTARRVPGVMAFLGIRAGDEDRPLHSPFYDLDESALPLGVAVLAGSAIRLLNAPS